MKIAVVILNYNGKNWLSQFLPTVLQHTTYEHAEIIVADNASTDDSVEFLHKNFPTIKYLQNPKNNGYAGGYNDALKQIEADVYCLLNSDVEVNQNWIEHILPSFEDEKVAAVQPKLLSFTTKDEFEYAGASGGFIDKYGYPFCRGRIFDTVEKDKGQYDTATEIFWASGACLFVRAKHFHSVGGFDADFFAHQEEIDLCWRLKNLGYKIMYQPKSVVYHVGGGTLNKSNPRKTFLNFRNNRILLKKNMSDVEYNKIAFVRNLLDLIAIVMTLLKGNFEEAKAIIKGLKAFQKNMNLHSKKRDEFVQQSHTLKIGKPNTMGIYNKSIVFDYFVKKKKTFPEGLI